MKRKLLKCLTLYFGVLYACIVLLPLGIHWARAYQEASTNPIVAGRQESTVPPKFAETAALLDTPQSDLSATEFRMYDNASKKIITVNDRAFLFGALACEMAPTVPPEALKAQVVALYSYYARLRVASEPYDFACDTAQRMTYRPRESFLADWGDAAAENEAKLQEAIDAVYGEHLWYGEELACAAFFPVSSGKTETAAEIWGKEYPYLVSVASPYDVTAPGYENTHIFTAKEIRKIMEANWETARYDFTLPCDQWFSQMTYTLGGGVSSVTICGFSITGSEARDVFALGSSTFAVEYRDNQFLFHVRGQGHGVGMSQTGATYMAAEGADYQEILAWYYPGTTLKEK